MPVSKPLVITAPDIAPPAGREWWFVQRELGPKFTSVTTAQVFYGWTQRTLLYKLTDIAEEYDVPRTRAGVNPGREFYLYDVERITSIFLKRHIIEYNRYYAVFQIMIWMGRNHNLL